MIVPMKKVSILVQSKDIDFTLHALGRKGILHIEHQKVPSGEGITTLKDKYNFLSKAIEELSDVGDQKQLSEHPEEFVSQILSLVDKKEVLLEDIKKIKKEIEIWEDWGDFDPGLIDGLRDEGVWVRLCKVTKKELKNIPEGVILQELFKRGSIIYAALISRKEIKLPFHTVALPKKSLRHMLSSQEKDLTALKEVENRLLDFSRYKKALAIYKNKLTSLIEFNTARAGMGSFEKLSYAKGYCPIHNVNSLEKLAEKEKWALLIEDPTDEDNVPTLVKNPRWIEIIRPIFGMIKTIPGYKEVDISFWFLLFFSVFFGMLIGDAGYGALFFIINLICHIKFRKRIKNKSFFFLTYVLSLSAAIWGVLTGTFFGQSYLAGRVRPLLPYLRESANVQSLCFFIGAIHLSIAHLWRFLRKSPSIRAFSEVGWVSMIWASYFLAKLLILGESFPEYAMWLLVGGASLIILFTNPSKNIFKGIGAGIGDFLLRVINSFTDVVSYIRLFAVGAATVAVADAFNQMAFGIGTNSIINGLLVALILLFGHTLNILLGAMAVLVHGVRLNVLEFSSHLNMEFSGVEYAPFRGEGD